MHERDKYALRLLLLLLKSDIGSTQKESEMRFCLCSCFTLYGVLLAFLYVDNYPRIDCKIMKTLFLTGKIVEWLKREGDLKSDRPAKAGRKKRKGYVDENIYHRLLYAVVVEGRKPNAICKKIRNIAHSTRAGQS